MDSREFVSRALTVPFKPRGRDFEGWDCWGLVWQFYFCVLNTELPQYSKSYVSVRPSRDLGDLIEREKFHGWLEINRPEFGDVILLRCGGEPVHVGVSIASNRMLHVEATTGTVIEYYTSPLWRDRVCGFWRPTNTRK